MVSKFIIVLLHVFLFLGLHQSRAQTWIQAGYWVLGSEFPISDINAALFTHLICAYAQLNPSSYQLSVNSDEQYFSVFTNTVKQKNPSIITLLSVGGEKANHSVMVSMVSNSSHRKSFIDSSIKIARLYGFQGLDFVWLTANTSFDMSNMATLFEEWRAAINSEPRNSSQSQLILTAVVLYSRYGLNSSNYPVDSLRRNLNWLHVLSFELYTPTKVNFTSAHGALYDPISIFYIDFGIDLWIEGGLPANKLVLGLPFYGYAWTLANPKNNIIGAPALGPAILGDGALSYKEIKKYMQRYGATSVYNATYGVNYCSVGAIWIGFDDVEAVKAKVSYAKKKKLLGYYSWQVSFDDNGVLSQAAHSIGHNQQNKRRLLLISTLIPTIVVMIFVGALTYHLRRVKIRKRKMKEMVQLKHQAKQMAATGDFHRNDPNLIVYSFSDVEVATNRFSFENKLGEGGYGPVYKGVLSDGQEIAIKKLSKASTQGFEEFKNEVMLTAKLQHVNLVRLLGFCIDRKEQILVYEYMPNKSLDYYLYDPIKRFMLDWRKRVEIIEGITQGLLYLQEYSRLTIIHRDLKASNILLDENMKPKISDFGMARIFLKDEVEANTHRIVGTYGYVPPEYVKKGIYSTKSDVYSFGVLLLQVISGKKNAYLHGLFENLNLLDFAYELWIEGKGMELMDPSLDDTTSSLKLLRCMQVALLCVQENANDRPTMLDVSLMLRDESTVMAAPKRPAFSIKTKDDEEKRSEIYSVDDSTISEVVAR